MPRPDGAYDIGIVLVVGGGVGASGTRVGGGGGGEGDDGNDEIGFAWHDIGRVLRRDQPQTLRSRGRRDDQVLDVRTPRREGVLQERCRC